MSWSIGCAGRPADVAAALRAMKGKNKLSLLEEEALRVATLETLAQSAELNKPTHALQVTASGSMWKDAYGVVQNSLEMKISPIFGWVDPPAPAAESAA